MTGVQSIAIGLPLIQSRVGRWSMCLRKEKPSPPPKTAIAIFKAVKEEHFQEFIETKWLQARKSECWQFLEKRKLISAESKACAWKEGKFTIKRMFRRKMVRIWHLKKKSLSLLNSNSREEIKAMRQMRSGHLFIYFQSRWKANSGSSERERGAGRGSQLPGENTGESGHIWSAGVDRSSCREGLDGRKKQEAQKLLNSKLVLAKWSNKLGGDNEKVRIQPSARTQRGCLGEMKIQKDHLGITPICSEVLNTAPKQI